tara:strand:- start:122 stop:259 length:138 start_codon:yes stop_codon:yes gene_type:complete
MGSGLTPRLFVDKAIAGGVPGGEQVLCDVRVKVRVRAGIKVRVRV